MLRIDQESFKVWVFTFKEGLLSRVAHDLKLVFERFSTDVGEQDVEIRFDMQSLRVLGAMRNGCLATDVLSPRDAQKIEGQIRKDVLHSHRFPEAVFRSKSIAVGDESVDVTGELRLHGRMKNLAMQLRRNGELWSGELELHQPDFGIRPYTAALGALKVKPVVRVRIQFAADFNKPTST